MASLNLEQFGDLVELTVKKYIKSDYVSLLTDTTDHPAAKQLINKNRMNGDEASPEGVQWKVRMGTANSYEHITPTTPDRTQMSDDFQHASCPWRKTQVSYSFLEEQIDFNMGPLQIVNLVKAKEQGADFDWIEGMEEDFWSFPSAGDTNNYRSLPYWVVKNATEGFNGGTATGYSDTGGLSGTTWPRWNNWSAQYTTISLDDLIKKCRTMAERTNFKPPVSGVPDLGATGPTRAYYTNLSVKQTFEDILDSRNDDLGTDIAKNDNETMFRKAPVEYVPMLNSDTTNPIYQLNWNVFKLMVRQRWWQRRTVLKPWPGQRNQVAVFKDTYANFACYNRRLCGVIATGTTYP